VIPDSIRVDGDRLWQSLMDMAAIGATPAGGSCRLALSDEDKAGRDLFVSWCKDAGCSISFDNMGNIFARRAGRRSDLPPIAAGSHLDTQPHGGKFDGVYGVLAALEVIRTLNDHGVETEAPLEVVVWTNEEGARFAPAMIASGVFAGLFSREFALTRADADGKTLGEELERIGYLGSEACGAHSFGALFGAHIEQGPILEREGKTIGVVIGGQGQRWYDVRVTGQDSHSGSTPMEGRRDALAAAALLVTAIEEIAQSYAPLAVGTVGALEVYPNSRNTIPGRVSLTVDFRHPDDDTVMALGIAFQARAAKISLDRHVGIEINEIWVNPSVHFDAACVCAVRNAARDLGYQHKEIFSGAGHDACMAARKIPASMIFVPCEGGLSHNEAEHAEPSDLEAGCNVLLHAMLGMSAAEALER
jgi:N-carbamoyl-L-amino-acid hydrolase